MFRIFIEFGKNLGYAAWTLMTILAQAGITSAAFLRDSFRAHFNLIAKYTAPIEQDLLGTEPPEPNDLNLLGQIALFPVLFLAWLSALTVAPLLYNSLLLFVSGFIRATNLGLWDFPEAKLPEPEGELSWYRMIFGALGLLLGGLLGLGAASVLLLVRVVINSFQTAFHSFFSLLNLANYPNGNLIEEFGLERKMGKKLFFGFPGILIGGLLGILGAGAFTLIRVVINSIENTIWLTKKALNAVRDEKNQIKIPKDHRPSFYRKFVLGFPGLVIGLFTSFLAVCYVGLERMVHESWKTTKEFYGKIMGKSLDLEDPDFEVHLKEATKEVENPFTIRNFFNRYVLGGPGIFLGVFTGSIHFVARKAFRIAQESYETAKWLTILGFNLPRKQIDYSESRSRVSKFILGFPGLILGLPLAVLAFSTACLQRAAVESWESAKEAYDALVSEAKSIMEDDVEEDDSSTVKSENPARSYFEEHAVDKGRYWVDRYFFGFGGLIAGGIIGAFGYAGLLTAHSLQHSFESFKQSFGSITNLGLHRDHQIEGLDLQKDTRPAKQKYVFGIFGVVFGGFVGLFGLVVWGVLRNSFETAKRLTASALNSVRETQFVDHLENDERHFALQFILGLPGLIIGSFISVLGIGFEGLKQTNIQSWKTTQEFFTDLTNKALPEEEDVDEFDLFPRASQRIAEERSFVKRFVLGAPGVLLGLFTGTIGFMAIMFARIMANSFRSFGHSFATIASLALPSKIEGWGLNEETNAKLTYGFGLPGVILGGFMALISLPFISFGRIVTNSFETGKRLTISAINLARYENEQFEETIENDNSRANHLKFGLGFPGLVLGSPIAFMGLLGSILRRSAFESWETGKDIAAAFIDKAEQLIDSPQQEKSALDTEDHNTAEILNLEQDVPKKRGIIDLYILSAPGALVGFFIGVLGFSALMVRQVFIDSYKTTKYTFVDLTNLATDPDDLIQPIELQKDQRSSKLINGFGFPGRVIGGLVGLIGIIGIIAARVVNNSFLTMKSLTASGMNLILEEPIRGSIQAEDRSRFRVFGLGFPGLIVGSVTALGGMAVVAFNRFIINQLVKHSLDSGARIFTTLSSFSFDSEEENPFTLQAWNVEDHREWYEKYLLSIPGLLIGGFLGIMTLVLITAIQATIQSFNSWKSLSGSLINGSLERPLFEGLRGDKRSTNKKILGGLGYAFALVTTLPVSLFIFTFRTVLPYGFALLFSVICSPFVALAKGIQLLINKPRFEESIVDDVNFKADEKEARFKNLYSSLTWGDLNEGAEILENQNGRKGPARFVQKAFTLNISTLTEFVMDKLLAAYRASSNKDEFFNNSMELQNAVKEIKDHYKHEEAYNSQIDDLVAFVKNYITKKENKVEENFYSKHSSSWVATFWGAEPKPAVILEQSSLNPQFG